MEPMFIEIMATIFFSLAIVHTFSVSHVERLSHQFPQNSVRRNTLHLFSDVEAIFGIWSLILIFFYSFKSGIIIFDDHHHIVGGAMNYLLHLNYSEPVFVFVIMCMAATAPVLDLAEKFILFFSKVFPVNKKLAFYTSALIFGPLLGSFITEPAAMTVTALLLLNNFYNHKISDKFKYGTLSALFVNVSIGGTLTNFAAPPVLMVAAKYDWDMNFMISNFGYKATIAVILNTFLVSYLFRKEIKELPTTSTEKQNIKMPIWMSLIHAAFVGLVVWFSHYPTLTLGVFVFFIGFTSATKKYQTQLKIKESLLVGFFLAGLVTLGSLQEWWLKVLLTKLSDLILFIGATGLTAITDNAALTYLGSLAPLSDSAKFNLVSGAVTGGGLTVIANAPNPAGYGLLKPAFGENGISSLSLFIWGIVPTIIAAICFKLLPSL